jgi:hypothetical protein
LWDLIFVYETDLGSVVSDIYETEYWG